MEDLVALSWRFDNEAFNNGNLEVVDELIHPDFINHDPLPGQEPDKAGIRNYIPSFRSAFPDLHCENEFIVADDTIVAHRLLWSGTHQGEYLGVAATGKKIRFVTHDFQRWENGQLIERWSIADTAQMQEDLGLS